MTEQDKDTQAGERWEVGWKLIEHGDGYGSLVVTEPEHVVMRLEPLEVRMPLWLAEQIIADHNARLVPQDAQDGEWRVWGVSDGVRFGQEGSVAVRGEPGPGVEIRSLQGMCDLANVLTARVKELERERDGYRKRLADALRTESPETLDTDYRAALERETARAQRFEQVINDFLAVMGRDSAGDWFMHREDDNFRAKVSGLAAALEEATDEGGQEQG